MSKASANESLFDRLDKAQVYEEFCALMFDSHPKRTYEDLLDELEKWNISSSLGALSRFKLSHHGRWAMNRALEVQTDFLDKHGADLDETTRKMVAMRIFQDAASPDTSTKDVLRMRDQEIQMAKLKQDAVKLEMAERRLVQLQQAIDLQERKIKTLEAREEETKKDLGNNTLTEAERAARMRARFGV